MLLGTRHKVYLHLLQGPLLLCPASQRCSVVLCFAIQSDLSNSLCSLSLCLELISMDDSDSIQHFQGRQGGSTESKREVLEAIDTKGE